MAVRDLLDLVFPRACAACGGAAADHALHLCWDCLARVSYVAPPFCSLCGDPVAGRVDGEFVCFWCTKTGPHFERARSAARYSGVVRDLLRQFKYGHALWLRGDLAGVLKACVEAHYAPDDFDAVVAVPLFRARRRERGYNQAELLARRLARAFGKPLLSRCVARVRPTATQTHLTAAERATNVRDAFQVRFACRLKGRRLLLIDDVMTTGATVNECARALKEGGAERVLVATLARG